MRQQANSVSKKRRPAHSPGPQQTGQVRNVSLPRAPQAPQSSLLKRSHRVLSHAHESVGHLLEIYDSLQKGRGGGAPKTEEQDLLRAMVVIAGAGLDATLKQMAKDALAEVVSRSGVASEALREYLGRELKRGGDGTGVDVNELAKILTGVNPRSEVVEMLIEELVGESMQSYGQLRRGVQYFGLEENLIKSRKEALDEAFKARNEIVHEMDMLVGSKKRVRRPRQRGEMVGEARVLLEVAGEILTCVDKVLGP